MSMKRNVVAHTDVSTGPMKRKRRLSSVIQTTSGCNNNNDGFIQQTIIINSPSFDIHCSQTKNQPLQNPLSQQYSIEKASTHYASKNRSLQPRSKSSLAHNSNQCINENQYPTNKKIEIQHFSSNKPTKVMNITSFKETPPNPSGEASLLLQRKDRSTPTQNIINWNKVLTPQQIQITGSNSLSPSGIHIPSQQQQKIIQNSNITNFNNQSYRLGQEQNGYQNEPSKLLFKQGANFCLPNKEKIITSVKKDRGNSVANPQVYLLQTLGNSKLVNQEKNEPQRVKVQQKNQNQQQQQQQLLQQQPLNQQQLKKRNQEIENIGEKYHTISDGFMNVEMNQISQLKSNQNQVEQITKIGGSRHSVETNLQYKQNINHQTTSNKKMNFNPIRSNSSNTKRIETQYFDVLETDEPSIPYSSQKVHQNRKPVSSTLEIKYQMPQFPVSQDQRNPLIGKKYSQPQPQQRESSRGQQQQIGKTGQNLENFNEMMKIYNDTQLSKFAKNSKLHKRYLSNMRGGDLRAKTEMDESISGSLNILNQYNDLEVQASSEQLQLRKEKIDNLKQIQKTIDDKVQIYLQNSQINTNCFMRTQQDLNQYMNKIKIKKGVSAKETTFAASNQPSRLSNQIFSTLQENQANSTIQDFCYNFDLEV